jgi:hypothetical protein
MDMGATVPLVSESALLDDVEDLLLRLDEAVFPQEAHRILYVLQMDGQLDYYREEDLYLFNQKGYLEALKRFLISQQKDAHTPVQYKRGKLNIVLAAIGVRKRARALYGVPFLTVHRYQGHPDIPWELKRMTHRYPHILELHRRTLGDLTKLSSGKVAQENLDLTLIGNLASYCYHEALPKEWLRQFILQ